MKLIWTKNNTIMSKFIRWGLNEPVSHFAIVFDNKLVFHSNLLGVHLDWFNSFKKHSEIVFEKNIELILEKEEDIYQNIISEEDGRSYDLKAFAFFIFRGLLNRLFKIPFPKENAWQDPSQYLCTRMFKCIVGLLPYKPDITDYEMVSPYQLYLQLDKQWHD